MTASAGRQSVCLNMIVKNEAHVIRRCLDSLRPLIDRWLIVDTGSSDGTQDLIRRHLADVPGELLERPWVGFGHNRSEALKLAAPRADYLFFMDADDVMSFPPGWTRPPLDADAYYVAIQHGAMRHRRVALVRAALPWRYEGVLHEYLELDRPYSRAVLDGALMTIVGGGARSQQTEEQKFLRDAAVLEAALAQQPNHTRYAFYLAQSYRDAGHSERALQAYDHRACLPGFDQEVYLSLVEGGRIAARLEKPYAEVVNRFLRAFDYRPSRHEALGELLVYLRTQGPRWQLAYLLGQHAISTPPSNDELFVESAWHEWRCLDEFAIAAYWSGHYRESLEACERVLAEGRLPAAQRERVQANWGFARDKLGGAGL